MKSGILTLLFSFLLVFGYAQQQKSTEKINWVSLEEAEKLNKKEPRKIMVDLYTSWCGWCKRMDVSTFTHPTIVDYINKKYYAVKLNAETRDTIVFKGHTFVNKSPKENRRPTHEIAAMGAQNGRLGYPTIVYLDEELNRIDAVSGYQTPENIEPIITYFAENHYKSTPWSEYLSGFKSAIPE